MFSLKNKRVYLDYASLTPIDRRVLRVMNKASSAMIANPSSWYKEGVSAKKMVDMSRSSIAKSLRAHSDEIFFTSGGTESNNIALMGVIEAQKIAGISYESMHIVTSSIEHSSIMECVNHLAQKGVKVDLVPVDGDGVVIIDELKKIINPQTTIVSIMMVNNEVGSIQPIREVAKVIRRVKSSGGHMPILHTDASQAFIHEEINLENLGVDMLTLDGSKVYGPRGAGILYVRRETPIEPIIFGGGQETGLRSGTENVSAIVGLAKALDIAAADRVVESKRISELRDDFAQGLKQIRSDIEINGELARSSPHILNVSIPGVDSEFFVLQLDANSVACSTKSSCLRDQDESYVLRAMKRDGKTSVRFSFGRYTSKADTRRALRVIEKILGTPVNR